MKTTIRQLGCALLILASGAALAAEPEQCRTVRLGTVNWTDVVAS
ncbi:glycine/betaine ABC transporter substrate-binding protein, partial [Pseudomonas aeruginosa]|nr:glycine/betaine ABC transporter substrate-binding protein [Pseudomonas aeruginosa]